jgi:hypothetical protein
MDAENVVDGGIRHRGYLVLEALETMNITRPDAPKGFVTRLAEENGWTIERAEAADREYRRFLMLAWSTDEMVVPSRDVDAAWHEHLLHTRHYWDATCRDILGKAFHHDPGDGSPVDARVHAAGYERTLALYQRIFDEPAPTDVWPRGCSCAPAAAPTREVELAMPAWTVLAAASVIMLVITHGVIGQMVAAGLAVLAVIAAIARSQSRAAEARTGSYRPYASSYPAPRSTPVNMSKSRSSASGSGRSTSAAERRRQDERSRSSDDPMMATLWGSDTVTSTATTFAASDTCSPSASHSSHSSSHCDTGSSHSSHSSCGSSSSHSSCGSSSSSCGGSSSSCGGSSCGGGGCGGS